MIENAGDARESEDDPFLERVGGSLRSAEFVEGTFEQRLMEKIRLEGPPLYFEPTPLRASPPARPSWWRRERVVRVSPLKALAVAASLAGVIALGSMVGDFSSRGDTTPGAAAERAADTVHVMRFVFVDSGARSVELVGDFNAWTKGVNRLERSGAAGVWEVTIPLAAGRHEYAFIVNGSRWIADPLAPSTSDDFGTVSAIVNVGPISESAS
jgi:hypothetical protein